MTTMRADASSKGRRPGLPMTVGFDHPNAPCLVRRHRHPHLLLNRPPPRPCPRRALRHRPVGSLGCCHLRARRDPYHSLPRSPPIEDMTKALGKVLGQLIWFELDWRGSAPSREQRRQKERAMREAEREAMERTRKARRTKETQTEDGEAAPSGPSSEESRRCRFSESDVGLQQVRLDFDSVPNR